LDQAEGFPASSDAHAENRKLLEWQNRSGNSMGENMTDRLNLPVPIAQVDLPQEFGGISARTLGWLKHHP